MQRLLQVIFAMNIYLSAKNRLYDNHIVKGIRDYILNKQGQVPVQASSDVVTKHPRVAQVIRFIERIFEHNARFVDLLCLIILLELFLPILFPGFYF